MAITKSVSELVNRKPHRPLLTHLNADTAWLISFPRPLARAEKISNEARTYYHVIVDPWLDGEYIVGYRWIMAMHHAIDPSYKTIAQVRAHILDIERAAGTSSAADTGEPDAVVVSHYLGDHYNRQILEQIDPSVPVVSVNLVVKEIKTWNHFTTLEQMPDLDVNAPQSLWQTPLPASSCLPPYIRVGRIPDGGAYPELHWATLIAYSPAGTPLSSSSNSTNTETMLYSPHGIYANRLTDTSWATKHSRVLTLFHGLNPAWSQQVSNLGVENGQLLARKLSPRYWVPTHDEHLVYQGIIGWFQTKHKKPFPDDVGGDEGERGKGTVCKDMGNGEVFLLA